MDDPAQQNIPYRRRQSEASKISYRSGDVYFKDKEGKLRPGTAHTANNLEQRPQTLDFVAEDDLQHNNNTRYKTPFELAVERNTRSDAFKLKRREEIGAKMKIFCGQRKKRKNRMKFIEKQSFGIGDNSPVQQTQLTHILLQKHLSLHCQTRQNHQT